MSQPLRYSSSSCFSGDKGLPSPFLGPGRGEMLPPVWAGVPEGLNSRQMSQVLLRDPFRGVHRNLLRELSWPPFVSSPHLLEMAAKAQQDGASRGWEPSGRGGRPRGRQGGSGGHSENPVLFAQGFLVCWSDPPLAMVGMSHHLQANLLLMEAGQKGLPSESFVA